MLHLEKNTLFNFIKLIEPAFESILITNENNEVVYCHNSLTAYFTKFEKKLIPIQQVKIIVDEKKIIIYPEHGKEKPIQLNFLNKDDNGFAIFVSEKKENFPINLHSNNKDRLIKKQLLTVIQNMPSGVLMEDKDRNIALVNPEFLKIFSIPSTVTDLIGLNCEKYANVFKSIFKNEEFFIQRIKEILSKNETVRAEYIHTKDGRTISRDFSPIFINEELEGYLWNYVDVTENVKKDEIVRINEEKYRRVLENLDLGIIEVDLNNKITKAYPGFCRLTGYSPQELIGKSALDVLVFEDDKEFLLKQTQRRKIGETDVYEFKIKQKNGKLVWVIISGAPIYDINNNIIGSIGIHWDNSNTKRREEELKRAKETAELSSQAKKQFLANISHEIRTPINIIKGMADLLFETNLDPEQRQELQAIRISSKNLLEIVNDLLNLSKIEAGKIDLKSYEFSPAEIISESLELFTTQIQEKGLELKYTIDPKIPNLLLGDELKLKQIINNLISNSIKFTEKGGIFVEAFLIDENENDCLICLSFKDTGIGIRKDKQDLVFKQFMQADYDTTRKYGGTGLGLSITKELTEVMGGSIELISTEGKGSCFVVNIPFKKSLISERIISEKITDQIFTPQPNKKILLVEDSNLNKHLVFKIMEQIQCQISWAENGLEAIELVKNSNYDLILMDIQIPEMDGYATTEFIRKNLKKNIPIIALTANAAKEDANKAIQYGMNDFISKPFEKNKLLKIVTDYLNSSTKAEINEEKYNFLHLDYLNQISKGDPEFVKKILRLFVLQNQKKIIELDNAIATKNFDEIRKIAHNMKSGAKTLGIQILAQNLEQIENLGKGESTLQEKFDLRSKSAEIKLILNECEIEINTLLNSMI